MAKDLHIDIHSMSYSNAHNSGSVIENLSIKVEAGEFVSILGPSGAGKTTLLRIIAGIERRYTGKVLLAGEPVEKPTREIQIVYQDNRLLPWKTVEDNIRFAIRNSDGNSNALISECLERVGLSGKEKQLPKTLSGGEQGRVALARAFVETSEVLLMDEPFRNVDLRARYDLLDKLQTTLVEKPRTVILVSHCIEDAIILSDKIYVFPSNPMTNPSCFPVLLSRPRRPDSTDVADLACQVVHHVLKETSEG